MWTGAGFRRKLNKKRKHWMKARRIQFCLQGRLELLCKECWSYLVRFFSTNFFHVQVCEMHELRGIMKIWSASFKFPCTFLSVNLHLARTSPIFISILRLFCDRDRKEGGCEVEEPWKLHICEADVWGTKYSAGPAHRMQRLDYVDRNPSELQAFFVVVSHMNS